jgi:hypothetical protein
VYGSACTAAGKHLPPGHIQIDPSDKIGFHDTLEQLEGPSLDFILHSPGGYAEAAETIVEEIRRKFDYVRCIVPAFAKSAATMMAMACDEILLDDDAELGPIDPQMLTPNGVVPAEAIKEQFLKASEEIKADPNKITIWIPILQPMGPGLLVQCDKAIELSKQLVAEWLARYMFRNDRDAKQKAERVSRYLASHETFKSHARRVKLDQLRQAEPGLRIRSLREDKGLYGSVWELYCVMDIILSNTPIYKIFYNSLDNGMVRQLATLAIPAMLPGLPPGMLPPGIPVPQPPTPPSQEPPVQPH